jgi:4-hydroxy-tetrahydrodipicolinate synthase
MLGGATAEVYVPFDNDGALRADLLKESVEWLISKGVKSFFVNGVGVEGLLLDKEQRKATLEAALEVTGAAEVMVLATSVIREDTLELLAHAADCGAGFAVLTQPLVYPAKDVVEYFKGISSKSRIPLVLYNEKVLGEVLRPSQVASVLSLDEFEAYKDSTRDITHLMSVLSATSKKFTLLAGSDGLIYSIYSLGGKGIVSLAVHVVPQLVLNVVKSYNDGDLTGAFESQMKLNRVRDILKSYGFSAGYRYAASLIGNNVGLSRSTTERLSKKEEIELKSELEAEGVI